MLILFFLFCLDLTLNRNIHVFSRIHEYRFNSYLNLNRLNI